MIETRGVDVPGLGVGDGDGEGGMEGFGGELSGGGGVLINDSAGRVGEGDLDGAFVRSVGLIEDGGVEVEGGLIGGEVGGGDSGGGVFNVDGVLDDEAGVAVDACAAVPAAGGLPGGVGADGENVGAGAGEVIGEVIAERDVAIGSCAEEGVVHVDFRVGHDGVEFDVDAFAFGLRGEGEGFAVPGDAGGEVCAGASGGRVFVEGAFNGPVVGEVEFSPVGVFDGVGGSEGGVAFGEAPVGVEGEGDARGASAAWRWVVRREKAKAARRRGNLVGRDMRAPGMGCWFNAGGGEKLRES